jgi:uncharacterized membrane protein
MVNTLAYVAIAIASVYIIHRALKGRIRMDSVFIAGALAFVLFGSTMRVVTDSIDSKVFTAITPIHQSILDSHILDYGYLTVSPGIYIVTAAIYLTTLYISYRLKKPGLPIIVGIALWLPLFLLLLPFMRYAVYALPVLALALIPSYAAWLWIKDAKLTAIVAGQALDGAATFFVIDIFSKISGIEYFEQHVLSSAIGQAFNTFFVFYIAKVAISVAAAYILSKEKDDVELFRLGAAIVSLDRYYIALVLMIIGFAPGIRDVLRMAVGA